MRNIILILFLFLSTESNSQNIDYDNFDVINAEKEVSLKLNQHRRNNNVEEVLFSNSIYELVSTKQMSILVEYEYIHHPSLLVYQNDYNTMKKISDESESLVGLKTLKWTDQKFSIQLFEIIYFTTGKFLTYQELAYNCVDAFHNSNTGHRFIQLKSYKSKNKKGLFSCKVAFTKKGTYVLINFALVDR